MKIKLDENIPVRVSQKLQSLGHDVDTVLDESLGGLATDCLRRHPNPILLYPLHPLHPC